MFINLQDYTKLPIAKALRNGCMSSGIARQFNISVYYVHSSRYSCCPALVKPATVQSYATGTSVVHINYLKHGD